VASADVDVALNAPPGDRAGKLLSLREGQWFDRKSARIPARKLAEALTAFANADGGFIVVGALRRRS
jgi:ATP-dependent DNA helicase RecG